MLPPKTYIIGDVHGCGIELQNLLEREILFRPGIDTCYLVGDLFDRGMYGSVVWEMIHKYGLKCIIGNHEQKMLQYIRGIRTYLSPHYFECFAELEASGITKDDLADFIQKLPRLIVLEEQKTIVTHGGVVPHNPTVEHESANTYGNYRSPVPVPKEGDGNSYWWESYKGDYLILYGHFCTPIGDPPRMNHNSIGLDTGACHGGALTGYCIEDKEFITYETGIDWFKKLQDEMACRQVKTAA